MQKVDIIQPESITLRNRFTHDSIHEINLSLSVTSPPSLTIIVHDFSSRSGYGLNPVRPPDSRKWTANCNHLQSPFRAGDRQLIINRCLVIASLHHRWISTG